MEKDKLVFALDMTDYQKKIENYDFDKLTAEKQKILGRMDVSYIHMGFGTFSTEKLNIANDPDEKNRIYVRKKVAMISKIISGQLADYAVDFAPYWRYINEEFLKTTCDPDYVTARLQGKTVPFADKLNLQGLTAYKRYLLLLSENLEKMMPYFQIAVQNALEVEMDVDQNLDRDHFYTRYFLPQNIDAVFKNLMKERAINKRIKEVGNVKKQEKADVDKL